MPLSISLAPHKCSTVITDAEDLIIFAYQSRASATSVQTLFTKPHRGGQKWEAGQEAEPTSGRSSPDCVNA